jgi:hypothetical protein
LESLPAVGEVACSGELSAEQLEQVVKLADESSDAEWAARAPNMTPADLARQVCEQRKPTRTEANARRDARQLWMKWDRERGMLRFGGEAPDLLGAKIEATITKLVDRMRPKQGVSWEPWRRRAVDALGVMCDAVDAAERIETPMAAAPPLFVTEVGMRGPATVAGIPLPDTMVEQLRAMASLEPLLVDDDGVPIAIGRRKNSLSPKIIRAVLVRDGHCRCGDCDLRFGLHVHHIRPRTWGGGDELANLVAVASVHHPMLIPNGPYAIVGNPNLPDGLRTVHVDDLTAEEAEQVGLVRGRRKRRPDAA